MHRATELPAPADAVWRALMAPQSFEFVAAPVIRYPVATRGRRRWAEGDVVVGWTLLFGVLPFSRHTLRVHRIDHAARTFESREHGGLVRRWHHMIAVTPIGEDRCRYEDRLEIEAGALTRIVVAFARGFYGHRQRRWQRLARILEAAGDGAVVTA